MDSGHYFVFPLILYYYAKIKSNDFTIEKCFLCRIWSNFECLKSNKKAIPQFTQTIRAECAKVIWPT